MKTTYEKIMLYRPTFSTRCISPGEYSLLLGVVCGRVSYEPIAKYIYSVRLFILFWKLEVNWFAGLPNTKME